jgi:hypothetical protein
VNTYSFGVVLLELVTGKPPVGDPDFGDTTDLVKWVCTVPWNRAVDWSASWTPGCCFFLLLMTQ